MSKNINFLKKEQRILLSEKRENLKNQIEINNEFFFSKLLSCEWFNQSKIIASFLSIKSEISTNFLNNFIQSQGKSLCLPAISDENKNKLTFKTYSENDKLIIGKYNVREPKNEKVCLPDIIFTPCLGFDLNGYRLGYGGGYYDRTIAYLHSISHSFLTVGLAYDDQKVDDVIHSNYDQKINYILTEKQLYKIS